MAQIDAGAVGSRVHWSCREYTVAIVRVLLQVAWDFLVLVRHVGAHCGLLVTDLRVDALTASVEQHNLDILVERVLLLPAVTDLLPKELLSAVKLLRVARCG